MSDLLKVNEVFFSIQGESSKVGLPTVFIRLTSCPLRCTYCDTEYAFYDGKQLSLTDILKQVSCYKTQHVTVTGGEPLVQKNCRLLLNMLCDENYQVSLETSGAVDLANIDARVCKVVDIKTPGSGESGKNRFQDLQHINHNDQIKFVICDRNDYEWSKASIEKWKLHDYCALLFSNSYHQLDATTLANWILEDQLPIRLQVQLHKYLWGDIPGH